MKFNGGSKTHRRLAQIKLEKVLRASFRKSLSRAAFARQKRHLAKLRRTGKKVAQKPVAAAAPAKN